MNRMIAGTGILALLVATPAFAADLSTKAPVYKAAAAVPFSWTGCFVGGHIGGVVNQDSRNAGDFSSSGFVGGGQVGCDYQFASGWVLGVEGRAAWTSLQSTRASSVDFFVTGITVPSNISLRNDLLASTTARVGYSIADRWMGYVRGGGAWTQEKTDDAFRNLGGIAVDPSASLTRSGWTVGAGVDWAFAPHWSANVEYNYYDFGDHTFLLTEAAVATTVNVRLKDTIHAVTTGVNYHF
jgi:outer membrane immunogenic protein